MVGGDDVLLRVLADVTDARRNIEFLRTSFLNAVRLMEEAARRPDFDPTSEEARRLSATVHALGQQFVRTFNQADKEVLETGRALNTARSDVGRLDDTLRKLRGAGGGQFLSLLGDIRNVLGSVGVALSGAAVLGGLRSFTQGLIDAGIAVQTTRIQLEALRAQLNAAAGSTTAGGEAYEFAKRKALELGFALEDVVQAQARFEAATRQSNLTLLERRSLFESVIETGRVLQLSQQRVNNAFLALEQIASKGRVSLEELRRQLGDQIPGVLPILARELGVTVGELLKMVEEGKLLADDVLPALDRGLRKTFGPGLAEALETDAATIGRLRTQIVLLKDEFGRGFAEETSAGLRNLADAAEAAGPAARVAGEAVGVLTRGLSELIQSVPEVRIALTVLQAFIAREYVRAQEEAAEATRQQNQALNIYADAILRANRTGKIAVEDLEVLATGFAELANKIINAGEVSTEMQMFLKAVGTEFANAYERAGRDVPKFIEDISGAFETMREKLDAAVKKEREFLEQLFETSGALFKNKKELEELTLLYLRATAGVAEFGAASADQSAKALDFALKLAQGYRDMGAAVPTDLLDKIERLAQTSVEGAEKAAKALREQADAYAALGEAIPEDLLARYERLRQLTVDHERAVALSVLGLRNFREALLGSGDDLATEAEQLYRVVTAMGQLGITTVEQREVIEEALQKILDRYAELGEKPPAHFQALADSMGVLTTRIEKEVEAQKSALEGLLKTFEKLKTAAPGGDVQSRLAALKAELAEIEGGGPLFDVEDLERAAELRAEISRLEADYRKLGDTATASVDDISSALRDFYNTHEATLGALPAATQEAVANILGGLQDAANEGRATQELITDALKRVADQFEIAGVDVGDFRDQIAASEGEVFDFGRAMDELAQGTEGAAGALGELGEKAEEAKTEQEKQREEMERHKEVLKELAQTAQQAMADYLTALGGVEAKWQEINQLCERHTACLAGAA